MVRLLAGQARCITSTFELSLAPTAAAPAAARERLTSWLEHCGYDGAVADIAKLLGSELVTNSVRHAEIAPDEAMGLTASVDGGAIRIAVRDGGLEGHVGRRGHQERDNVGGFGLELVERLASAWGVDRDDRGTTVWLEIATPRQATS